MEFKKNDKWTVECARRGYAAAKKKDENFGKRFKKDDQWTIECRKKSHRTRRRLGHYSKMGRLSRIRENVVARQLNKEYEKMWLPQEICDRIVIKDGKLFFIEIKRNKGELTENQRKFREIIGKNYIVIRSP